MKERLQALGARDRRAGAPHAGLSRQFVKSEIEKWAAPIKKSGAQLD